ncbi:MAG TPA: FliM/FliN family flagellar motor C-terminal domain-containing protein [Bryobacteraceae bacterium]|nr:FliM/FliN family flagellar motor C-terminal domain-containing protein [Bryobacteraceae bacterium]
MNPTEILNRYESLPFEIAVEVGSLEMKISEILQLKVGTVIQTGHIAGTPLTLRAGGAPLAAVELLTIKDRLSARVKSMLDNAPAAPAGGSTN